MHVKHLFPPPSLKEKKPEFAEIPAFMLERIGGVAGSRVVSGEAAYGGFSASANFVLALEDGRKVFAKGNHPGEQAHGIQNLRQEIAVYEKAAVLKDIAPRYLGFAWDGDEDGWALGVWEYIAQGAAAGADEMLEALGRWRVSDQPWLRDCREQNYIEQFFSPEKKWLRLAHEDKVRRNFTALFEEEGAAEVWLEKNLPALCALQAGAGKVKTPFVPLHGDLRDDNIFKGADGKVYIVDWPNACRGPAVFDLLFLGASLGQDLAAGEEGAAEVAAAISGYMAGMAGRAVPEKLPRLRWMQKTVLLFTLRVLGAAGAVESPPRMKGQLP